MMEQELLDQYKYLVRLRDSGATNMFGASDYLTRTFGLKGRDATTVLMSWMDSFSLPEGQQPKDGR